MRTNRTIPFMEEFESLLEPRLIDYPRFRTLKFGRTDKVLDELLRIAGSLSAQLVAAYTDFDTMEWRFRNFSVVEFSLIALSLQVSEEICGINVEWLRELLKEALPLQHQYDNIRCFLETGDLGFFPLLLEDRKLLSYISNSVLRFSDGRLKFLYVKRKRNLPTPPRKRGYGDHGSQASTDSKIRKSADKYYYSSQSFKRKSEYGQLLDKVLRERAQVANATGVNRLLSYSKISRYVKTGTYIHMYPTVNLVELH